MQLLEFQSGPEESTTGRMPALHHFSWPLEGDFNSFKTWEKPQVFVCSLVAVASCVLSRM